MFKNVFQQKSQGYTNLGTQRQMQKGTAERDVVKDHI